MTNEEKASVLEELYAYLCGEPGKEAPEYNRMREAMQAAISSLRSVPADDPLTLEQLREMVDKPAYLYIYDTALNSGWHIIKSVTENKIIFRGWDKVYVPISSLGKSFDLYAYSPAHIDRETCGCEY